MSAAAAALEGTMSDGISSLIHSPITIGTVIGGYRVMGELNAGGMGMVYRAEHTMLGKLAALKLLHPQYSSNPDMVNRFFNEARAATAIRHPGIVEVFDFGYHTDGRAYLVMEFLEGQTLGARLEKFGRMSEADATVIVRGITSALAAAHAKGIVHRDLKPDNIFLVADPDMPNGERPKVLDFGIAKLTGGNGEVSKTQTGTMLGTPRYMAPEQARGAGDIDHRADLYSLGCLYYELLIGQPPFVAEGAGEIIAMQMFAAPELPSARLQQVSPAVDEIVRRLLLKDPAARLQTAQALMEAFEVARPMLSSRLSVALTAQGTRPSVVMPPSASSLSVGTASGMQVEAQPGPGMPSRLDPQHLPPGVSTVFVSDDVLLIKPTQSPLMPLVAALGVLAVAGGIGAYILTRTPSSAPTPTDPPPLVDTLPTQPPPIPPPGATPAAVRIGFNIRPVGFDVTIDARATTLSPTGFLEVPRDTIAHHIELTLKGYRPVVMDALFDVDKMIVGDFIPADLSKAQAARKGLRSITVQEVGPRATPTTTTTTTTTPAGPAVPGGSTVAVPSLTGPIKATVAPVLPTGPTPVKVPGDTGPVTRPTPTGSGDDLPMTTDLGDEHPPETTTPTTPPPSDNDVFDPDPPDPEDKPAPSP